MAPWLKWLRARLSADRPKAATSATHRGPIRPLLNLGCGRITHPDWLNVDLVARVDGVVELDLRRPLPYAEGSFRAVYHSHVLEHLAHRDALPFLRECHRLLAPGGCLRVVVPDLEAIARLYLSTLDGALAGDPGSAIRYEWMTLELLDQLVRDRSGGEMLEYWRRDPMPAEEFVLERAGDEIRSVREELRRLPPAAPPPAPTADEIRAFRETGELHQWMYDRWSLRRLLEQAGFVTVSTCRADESRIDDFNRYQLDTTSEGAVRKPDSLFMEALKP